VAALWAWCTSGRYRAAQSKAKSLRSSASSAGIAREIQAAVKERNEWLARGGSDSGPRSCGESLERLQSILAQAQSALEKLERLVGLRDLADRSIIDLAEFISALAADTGTLFRLPRKAELERLLQASHLGPFLDELRKRRVPASQWLAAFRHSWLTSMLDGIRLQDSALAGFDGQAHQRIVEEFHELDRQRLQIAVHRVQRVHAERVIAAMNDYPAQASLVRHESAKRARHMPLRKLLAQAPDVLTALFPCWMASPLAVSQLIGSDKRYFDVVLFDEASQVLPEDAAAALLRARRAVVAGDRNQLPPTMFFAAGDDELTDTDDDAAPTAGFESLLDIMSGLVEQWPLDWHYRSKDERLIAFANAHVYGNRLVTFPSANEAPAISHVLVTPTSLMDGQGESPSDEVSRVVDLVLQHAAERPHESLGVITLGIKHANRIQAAIDQARLIRSDLDEFFDEHAGERFFVKNLERVQGDERDSVILSVGVGKLRTGVVDYRGFGPLNGEGGHRRLNVAITRARRRMTVVSAFTHFDMDPQRGGGTGMLRDYLQYASSGGASFGDGHQSGTLLNAFETDITETLQAEGIPVVPQWGASKYRIDLVARHPERPGQFVLAIECDGASYHAAPTARDRDRLRQQHLESLGWRFHRIWSTDWFQHRDDEVKRVKAAYAAAVEVADGPSRIARASAPAAHAQLQDLAVKTPAQTRGPKPFLIQRQPIDDYTLRELRSLLTWIVSDGRLRTNDELVEELVNELGYSRRGGRIMQRLQHLVRSV